MGIGAVGTVASGMVSRPPVAASAGQGGQTPAQLPPPQQQQSGACSEGHPGYLRDMPTETFMALRTQADGQQSALEGLKKVLEVAAALKVLQAMQQI